MSDRISIQHLTDDELQGVAEGTLRGPQRFEALEHCAACEQCGEDLALYTALCERLDGLEDPAVPEDFTVAVLQRADERAELIAQRRQMVLAAIPAAALALFAVIGWVVSMPVGNLVSTAVELVDVAGRVVDVVGPVISAARLQLFLASLAFTAFIAFALFRAVRTTATVPARP